MQTFNVVILHAHCKAVRIPNLYAFHGAKTDVKIIKNIFHFTACTLLEIIQRNPIKRVHIDELLLPLYNVRISWRSSIVENNTFKMIKNTLLNITPKNKNTQQIQHYSQTMKYATFNKVHSQIYVTKQLISIP